MDRHDLYYNTEREHQALPFGMTPQDAWNATPAATPPTPPAHAPAPTTSHTIVRVVQSKGGVSALGAMFMIGRDRAGKRLHIIYDDDGIAFFDDDGTQIANHPRPPKGTRYIGNDKPRGFMATQQPSTKP